MKLYSWNRSDEHLYRKAIFKDFKMRAYFMFSPDGTKRKWNYHYCSVRNKFERAYSSTYREVLLKLLLIAKKIHQRSLHRFNWWNDERYKVLLLLLFNGWLTSLSPHVAHILVRIPVTLILDSPSMWNQNQARFCTNYSYYYYYCYCVWWKVLSKTFFCSN